MEEAAVSPYSIVSNLSEIVLFYGGILFSKIVLINFKIPNYPSHHRWLLQSFISSWPHPSSHGSLSRGPFINSSGGLFWSQCRFGLVFWWSDPQFPEPEIWVSGVVVGAMSLYGLSEIVFRYCAVSFAKLHQNKRPCQKNNPTTFLSV